MENGHSPAGQHRFELQSSEGGRPLSDSAFDSLFASGSIDSLLILRQTMRQTRIAMSLADATSPDHELVYVNEAFRRLTGYDKDKAIGRNCRFLQGPKTNQETVNQISSCLFRGTTGVFELVNYRADGTTFWNALHIGPVYDAQGKLRYYFGSQWDVSDVHRSEERARLADLAQREMNHRAMNTFSVISSLISLSAIGAPDAATAMKTARERVNALADAHRASMFPQGADREVRIGPLMERLLKPYTQQAGDNITVSGVDIAVKPEALTVIGMAVHELATNSIKYGFLGGKASGASLTWQLANHGDGGRAIHMVWEEIFDDGAPTIDEVMDGTGSRILRALLQPGDGLVERAASGKTFSVRLVIPLREDGV